MRCSWVRIRDEPQVMNKQRCTWAGNDVLYQSYHDTEWGVPLHDDQRLFEFLILEGAQAGLSWITILRKRENYRAAFDGFDANRIARYDANKIESLLQNAGIVRNRLKVEAAVINAQNFSMCRMNSAASINSSGSSSKANRNRTSGAAMAMCRPLHRSLMR
jgi:DNA-3-methyladenine glycosylase I